jgi:uncharacterized protein (TIGR02271 family)
MATKTDVQAWTGHDLMGADHDKIGKIDQIYADRQTGEPKFATVKTGLFGHKVSFVPIDEAHDHDGHVEVPYTKDQVKDAPNIDADGELSEAEEQRLYQHYGLTYSAYDGPDHDSLQDPDREARFARGEREGAGHDTSGPDTDDAMTRSEEELRVGTTSRETGRVRLRKYIVTEQVTQTVPVQREEVRIEREPITDANVDDALDGPAISEEEHEVVLHAEEPVVEKRAVPKERVRASKETVSDEETVSGEVRKERIETDGIEDER